MRMPSVRHVCASNADRRCRVKVSVVDIHGKRHSARRPEYDADHVLIDACPRCRVAPCPVRGTGITHHNRDTYFAPATAICCGESIGTLEAKVETLFGIDEDEAVLVHGRARVYDGSTGGRQ